MNVKEYTGAVMAGASLGKSKVALISCLKEAIREKLLPDHDDRNNRKIQLYTALILLLRSSQPWHIGTTLYRVTWDIYIPHWIRALFSQSLEKLA